MTCHEFTFTEYVRYLRNELPAPRYHEIHELLQVSDELNDTLYSIQYDIDRLQLNQETMTTAEIVQVLEREEKRRLDNVLRLLPQIEEEQRLVNQDVDRLCKILEQKIDSKPAHNKMKLKTAFFNFSKRLKNYSIVSVHFFLPSRKSQKPKPGQPRIHPTNTITRNPFFILIRRNFCF